MASLQLNTTPRLQGNGRQLFHHSVYNNIILSRIKKSKSSVCHSASHCFTNSTRLSSNHLRMNSKFDSERFGSRSIIYSPTSKNLLETPSVSALQAADEDVSITPSPDPDDEKKGTGNNKLTKWWTLTGWLFFFGMGLGPPLDGIHSTVGLQTYDVGSIVIGGEPYGLHTNIWVFPLLGIMYSAIGLIQLTLDRIFQSNEVKQGSWTQVLTCICVLIGLLRLSAQLYEDEMDYSWIFLILSFCAHGNWYAFDKTAHGYFLALLVAVAAPVSEAFIIKYFGLWHYSNPDIFIAEEGLVSWTSCCYFFYTQFVSSLAHCLQTYIFYPPKERLE